MNTKFLTILFSSVFLLIKIQTKAMEPVEVSSNEEYIQNCQSPCMILQDDLKEKILFLSIVHACNQDDSNQQQEDFLDLLEKLCLFLFDGNAIKMVNFIDAINATTTMRHIKSATLPFCMKKALLNQEAPYWSVGIATVERLYKDRFWDILSATDCSEQKIKTYLPKIAFLNKKTNLKEKSLFSAFISLLLYVKKIEGKVFDKLILRRYGINSTFGYSALHKAVYCFNPKDVQALLDLAGSRVQAYLFFKDGNRQRPLHGIWSKIADQISRGERADKVLDENFKTFQTIVNLFVGVLKTPALIVALLDAQNGHGDTIFSFGRNERGQDVSIIKKYKIFLKEHYEKAERNINNQERRDRVNF